MPAASKQGPVTWAGSPHHRIRESRAVGLAPVLRAMMARQPRCHFGRGRRADSCDMHPTVLHDASDISMAGRHGVTYFKRDGTDAQTGRLTIQRQTGRQAERQTGRTDRTGRQADDTDRHRQTQPCTTDTTDTTDTPRAQTSLPDRAILPKEPTQQRLFQDLGMIARCLARTTLTAWTLPSMPLLPATLAVLIERTKAPTALLDLDRAALWPPCPGLDPRLCRADEPTLPKPCCHAVVYNVNNLQRAYHAHLKAGQARTGRQRHWWTGQVDSDPWGQSACANLGL